LLLLLEILSVIRIAGWSSSAPAATLTALEVDDKDRAALYVIEHVELGA